MQPKFSNTKFRNDILKTTPTPATTENKKCLRMWFFTTFWLLLQIRVSKKFRFRFLPESTPALRIYGRICFAGHHGKPAIVVECSAGQLELIWSAAPRLQMVATKYRFRTSELLIRPSRYRRYFRIYDFITRKQGIGDRCDYFVALNSFSTGADPFNSVENVWCNDAWNHKCRSRQIFESAKNVFLNFPKLARKKLQTKWPPKNVDISFHAGCIFWN